MALSSVTRLKRAQAQAQTSTGVDAEAEAKVTVRAKHHKIAALIKITALTAATSAQHSKVG